MALAEMRRTGTSRVPGRAVPWLREARRAFPASARPLLDLIGPRGPWLFFANSVTPDIDEALDGLRAMPAELLRLELSAVWEYRPGKPAAWVRQLADGDREARDIFVRALSDLHAAVVAPRWDSVLRAFHANVASSMSVLAAGGHEKLFGTLDNQAADSPLPDTLAAMLGPTRAAVLRALRKPHGTAELAKAVRISPASASEHAKVLRDASLIETSRAAVRPGPTHAMGMDTR